MHQPAAVTSLIVLPDDMHMDMRMTVQPENKVRGQTQRPIAINDTQPLLTYILECRSSLHFVPDSSELLSIVVDHNSMSFS